MVSGTRRRVAVPMVFACMGVLGAAEAAQAQSGGLSVTPAILENRARLGTVGSLTLTNTTRETLRVRVNVRPWRQELNGRVITDPRSTFNRYVRATRRSFTLRGGAKVPLNFRMVRRTRSGSLYGNVDILGKPTRTRGRRGIIPQYRLISSLRLHPRTKTYRIRTGAAQIRSRTFVLPVRNLGNSIDPIGGTYRLSGPGSRSGSIRAVSVVPGKLVTLGLTSTRGFRKGRYTITASLSQGRKRFNVRTSVTLR
jgi:hypothetical protein